MQKFSDITVKCNDGEYRTLRVALYFTFSKYEEIIQTATCSHTINSLRYLLYRSYYTRFKADLQVPTYGEIADIYACAEALGFYGIDELPKHLCDVVTGEYHSSALPVLTKFSGYLTEKHLENMAVEAIQYLGGIDYQVNEKINNLSSRKLYELYAADAIIFDFIGIRQLSMITTCFNFNDIAEAFHKMMELLPADTETYQVYNRLVRFGMQNYKLYELDPTFNPDLFRTIRIVLTRIQAF